MSYQPPADLGRPPRGADAIALSLRQPWLQLVATRVKPIENRRWNTHYRGRVYLHASGTMARKNVDECTAAYRQVVGRPDAVLPFDLAALPRGGIVGHARLVDVYPPCGREGERCTCAAGPWHFPHHFGFRLADVETRPLVRCGGMLGLFRLKPGILAQLGE